jgi:ABC-type transport system involved in multi-copper enzyme maturation permease subunit
VTTRGVGFVGAAARVFELSWPTLLWGRRARWLALLLAWPLLLPLMSRVAGAPAMAWTDVVGGFYLDMLLPLVALFQASRLIREEVENRTIVYLLARPAPRPSIYIGRFAAYVAASLAVAWPAIALGYLLAGSGGAFALGQALASSAAALTAYGALFGLAGLVLAKPMVVSLVVLVVAKLLPFLPGYLPLLTPATYLHVIAGAVVHDHLTAGRACVALAALTVACLVAAVVVFKNGEYLPEP